jgi:hypothetical protein
MRKEVQELIHVCERLIGLARLRQEVLSNEECEAILYYVQDLEREVFPHWKKRHALRL